jgi:hypothetical protein
MFFRMAEMHIFLVVLNYFLFLCTIYIIRIYLLK